MKLALGSLIAAMLGACAANADIADSGDQFAPDTGGPGAKAVAASLIKITWRPNSEADLAGYRVYREVAGQPKQRLAELGPEKAAYLDETAAKGAVCRYTVTSFDRSGNESEPTDPVEATLP